MRALRWTLGAYLLAALATRLAEAAGMRRCGCAPDCWCKHPILSAFRWVFPAGHRGAAAEEKHALAEAGPSG